MVEMLTRDEQEEINDVDVRELDRQVMLGNWYPVMIEDGRITRVEQNETPAAGTARESR